MAEVTRRQQEMAIAGGFPHHVSTRCRSWLNRSVSAMAEIESTLCRAATIALVAGIDLASSLLARRRRVAVGIISAGCER